MSLPQSKTAFRKEGRFLLRFRGSQWGVPSRKLRALWLGVRSEELGVRSGGAARNNQKRRKYIWGDARN